VTVVTSKDYFAACPNVTAKIDGPQSQWICIANWISICICVNSYNFV